MEDKKEYTIFTICNGGKPYYIHVYDTLYEAQQDLYSMIELEKKRNRPYYVHNDFYKNEYPASINCKIFCIKERVISNWEIYSQEKEKKEKTTKEENNIIIFEKYI